MDDVVRWIEIKPSHTFMDFNNIIQEAIGFDNKELASFFVSAMDCLKLLTQTKGSLWG